MAQGPPRLDWYGSLQRAGKDRRLMALLDALPRDRWTERSPDGWTLLHYACRGDVAAVRALLAHGIDANAADPYSLCGSHVAASSDQPRVLEVLCAAGANMRTTNSVGKAPLDFALRAHAKSEGDTVRVLLANGVRLSTARADSRRYITPELAAFERGVLRCRAAVVALLRVKRASGRLARWDRFLLALMARDTWATRVCREWQL